MIVEEHGDKLIPDNEHIHGFQLGFIFFLLFLDCHQIKTSGVSGSSGRDEDSVNLVVQCLHSRTKTTITTHKVNCSYVTSSQTQTTITTHKVYYSYVASSQTQTTIVTHKVNCSYVASSQTETMSEFGLGLDLLSQLFFKTRVD